MINKVILIKFCFGALSRNHKITVILSIKFRSFDTSRLTLSQLSCPSYFLFLVEIEIF